MKTIDYCTSNVIRYYIFIIITDYNEVESWVQVSYKKMRVYICNEKNRYSVFSQKYRNSWKSHLLLWESDTRKKVIFKTSPAVEIIQEKENAINVSAVWNLGKNFQGEGTEII